MPEGLSQVKVPERAPQAEIEPAVTKLFEVAESIDEKVKKSKGKLSPELKAQIDQLFRKVTSFMNSRGYILGFTILATIATHRGFEREMSHTQQSESVVEQAPRDSVVEKDSAGIKVFTHSDSTTTHILNYFAGKDTLSENEVEVIYRNRVKQILEAGTKTPTPNNFDDMSIEEIAEFLSVNIKIPEKETRKPNFKEEDFRKMCREGTILLFKNLPRFLNAKEGVYEALWKIENETGAPKVRLMESDPKLAYSRLGYYISQINTVVMSVDRLYGYEKGEDIGSNPELVFPFFGEVAHSLQHHKNPTEDYRRSAEEVKERNLRAKSLDISSDSSQKLEYGIPGTVEHEAHSIMEPRLKEQFQMLVRDFGKIKIPKLKHKHV